MTEKCSRVWIDKDKVWVYKQQPKTLCDTEVYCLNRMYRHGYSPKPERVDKEIIRTRYIESKVVTDPKSFMWHLPIVLHLMESEGIRHGDLTTYAVIPNNNKPYIIDWAESRVYCDPIADKRPEGDEYWLTRTMEYYAQGNL